MNEKNNFEKPNKPTDIKGIISNLKMPKKAVVTAGMPYANGPLHLGHLAGVHVPADIFARWLRMVIGEENVLFVCGTDDHGSTSEVAAINAKKSVRDFIDETHSKQQETLDRYSISIEKYSGTSQPDCFPIHKNLSQDMFKKLLANGFLQKKVSKQWFDTTLNRFLQDRYVRGTCPNPKCNADGAYSDECDFCGHQYDPAELINPKSALSGTTPIMKDTVHWWLDMWKASDVMIKWMEGKKQKWRLPIYNEVMGTISPAFSFDNTNENIFKEIRTQLPKHKSRYAPGKKVVVQFESKNDYEVGKKQLEEKGIVCIPLDGWAYRSITRDVAWGIPLPSELDADMKDKTLYVWPDSLIAPIAFTQVALKHKNKDPKSYIDFWHNTDSKIYQFLGQDNVYFYVIMQAAMWLGSQADWQRIPQNGELQLTEIFSCFHLLVDGEKMSKSRGNFFTGDQLINEKNYDADQIRYFLALLTLPEKSSNFDFKTLDERNKFLSGPLNAAFEKPISAVHSKFGGIIPDGELLEKVEKETMQIVQKYVKAMEKADYSVLLFAIENYARIINSLFTQYKPHDDRAEEKGRKDALYSCFYVLKNLMIMLYPFVPNTMNRLRESLNLPTDIFTIHQLGVSMPAQHKIGAQKQYFPSVENI